MLGSSFGLFYMYIIDITISIYIYAYNYIYNLNQRKCTESRTAKESLLMWKTPILEYVKTNILDILIVNRFTSHSYKDTY